MEVGDLLDLSNCLSLESVEMFSITNLKPLSRLTSSPLCFLDTTKVTEVARGFEVLGLDQLDSLVRLVVDSTSLPLEHCIPHQLQELSYILDYEEVAPCLNAFKQLQVLDFSMSRSLKRMCGMGDLIALRSLNLSQCTSLKRLPNLSKSRSLEELNVDFCQDLELHEEDFEMLASLPLLQPVEFKVLSQLNTVYTWSPTITTYRLDIVGRKVLQLVSRLGCEWEELELVLFPFKIGYFGSRV